MCYISNIFIIHLYYIHTQNEKDKTNPYPAPSEQYEDKKINRQLIKLPVIDINFVMRELVNYQPLKTYVFEVAASYSIPMFCIGGLCI